MIKAGSQNHRLLAVLADGRWHTTRELLAAVPCIVHSRCSELRKRGYLIDHETTGPGAEGSRYRLTSVAPGPAATSTLSEASGEGNEPETGAAISGSESIRTLVRPGAFTETAFPGASREAKRQRGDGLHSDTGEAVAHPFKRFGAEPQAEATDGNRSTSGLAVANTASAPTHSPGRPPLPPAAGAVQLALEVAA